MPPQRTYPMRLPMLCIGLQRTDDEFPGIPSEALFAKTEQDVKERLQG